jgi:hypothetical protein
MKPLPCPTSLAVSVFIKGLLCGMGNPVHEPIDAGIMIIALAMHAGVLRL